MTLHTGTNTETPNVVKLGEAAKKAVKGLAEKTGKPTDLSQKPANSKTKPPPETAADRKQRLDEQSKKLEKLYTDWEDADKASKRAADLKKDIVERAELLTSKAAFKERIKQRKMTAQEREVLQGELFQLVELERITERRVGATAMGKKGGSAK